MLFVLLAAIIMLGAAALPRPGLPTGGALRLSGFNGQSVLAGFVLCIACTALLGMQFALPILFALLLRELGQVLAYRMLGHADARFRLAPFLDRMPVSDRPLTSDGQEFLTAIMGPAISLGPLVLAASLAVALRDSAPGPAGALWLLAATLGAVNFVLLLPFAPFDGARCMRCAVASYWPALTPAMAVFMSTAMFTASLRTGSVALMIAAAYGAQSLFHRAGPGRVPLKPDHGLIALAAYVFTLAAHFSAGWWLFRAYFS